MEIKPRQLEIIEATGKILTKSGVTGLTTKNLASEMNFSESALYRHFKSKEEIILSMLKYLSKNISTILKNSAPTSDAEKDFKDVFRRITLYFKENPYYVIAIFSEGLLDESSKIKNAIMSLVNLMTGHLQSVIEHGQQTGKFIATIPADDLAQIVIATYKHQMFSWRFQNFEFDIIRRIEEIDDTLLIILKNYPQ
ncbi:MAG: TetR/AcrR family transcriptional regulator [Petrimonas sp.]|nr:TetR/AcrR family transcriptional regulator [Petrimonas sp.]